MVSAIGCRPSVGVGIGKLGLIESIIGELREYGRRMSSMRSGHPPLSGGSSWSSSSSCGSGDFVSVEGVRVGLELLCGIVRCGVGVDQEGEVVSVCLELEEAED